MSSSSRRVSGHSRVWCMVEERRFSHNISEHRRLPRRHFYSSSCQTLQPKNHQKLFELSSTSHSFFPKRSCDFHRVRSFMQSENHKNTPEPVVDLITWWPCILTQHLPERFISHSDDKPLGGTRKKKRAGEARAKPTMQKNAKRQSREEGEQKKKFHSTTQWSF